MFVSLFKNPGTLGNNLGVFMIDAATMANFQTWSDANVDLFPSKIGLADYFGYTPGTTEYVSRKSADPTENKKARQ